MCVTLILFLNPVLLSLILLTESIPMSQQNMISSSSDLSSAGGTVNKKDEDVLITCFEGEYVCRGGTTCISGQLMCDGKSDCPEGDDETRCDKNVMGPSTGNMMGRNQREGSGDVLQNCSPGYLECRDHKIKRCIPLGLVCDGISDCSSGDDEIPKLCNFDAGRKNHISNKNSDDQNSSDKKSESNVSSQQQSNNPFSDMIKSFNTYSAAGGSSSGGAGGSQTKNSFQEKYQKQQQKPQSAPQQNSNSNGMLQQQTPATSEPSSSVSTSSSSSADPSSAYQKPPKDFQQKTGGQNSYGSAPSSQGKSAYPNGGGKSFPSSGSKGGGDGNKNQTSVDVKATKIIPYTDVRPINYSHTGSGFFFINFGNIIHGDHNVNGPGNDKDNGNNDGNNNGDDRPHMINNNDTKAIPHDEE